MKRWVRVKEQDMHRQNYVFRDVRIRACRKAPSLSMLGLFNISFKDKIQVYQSQNIANFGIFSRLWLECQRVIINHDGAK